MLKLAGAPKIIIYTLTKNNACKVHKILSRAVNSTCVRVFHGSFTQATKNHIHSEFQKDGAVRCLVSTIAFGMVGNNTALTSLTDYFELATVGNGYSGCKAGNFVWCS